MNSLTKNIKGDLLDLCKQLHQHPQLLNIEFKMNQMLQKQKHKFLKFSQCLNQILDSQLFKQFLTDIKNFNPMLAINEDKSQIFLQNKIFYEHLFHGEKYSIILILLPKGFQFTLHDHPEMLCIAKLLYGQLEIESMDLSIQRDQFSKDKRLPCKKIIEMGHTEPQKNSSPRISNQSKIQEQPIQSLKQIFVQKKKLLNFKSLPLNKNSKVFDSQKICNWNKQILQPNQINLTTPTKNNIHYFKALKDCIMIDFLSPDYESQKCFSYYEYVNVQNGLDRYIRKIKKAKQEKYLTIISDFTGMNCQ